jgi:hypothetical protein
VSVESLQVLHSQVALRDREISALREQLRERLRSEELGAREIEQRVRQVVAAEEEWRRRAQIAQQREATLEATAEDLSVSAQIAGRWSSSC